MNKSTILVFILSVMIFASIGAVAVIMIPDSNPESLTVKKYETISREDYTFVDTKNISLDSIEQKYEVDREYLNKLIKDQNYKPGTTNPFANTAENNGSNSGSSGSSGGSGSSSNGGSTSGSK